MASLPSSAAAPAAESKSGNPDVSDMQMAGTFFFVNPGIVPTQPLPNKIQDLIQYGNYTGAYYDRSHYDWACRQVRTAGPSDEHYACGDTIDPSFFNDDKMKGEISYVILYISERPLPSGPAGNTIPGGRTLTTNGFVVLKDLNFEEPGKQEDMLYIEGLCMVNKKIVPSTRGAAIGLMDRVHISSFMADYQGCKLSALVYVIQFYFNKFSYRFRKGCNQTREEIDALREINTWVSRLPPLPDENAAYGKKVWLQYLLELTKLGHNTEVNKSIAQRLTSLRDTAHEWDHEDEVFTSRVIDALQRAGWEDQGYYMYFCYHNNPMLNIIAGNPTAITRHIINQFRRRPLRDSARGVQTVVNSVTGRGGKKKRRKKTKKKALRKKHRKRSAKTHKKKRRKAGKSKRKRQKSKRKHKKK